MKDKIELTSILHQNKFFIGKEISTLTSVGKQITPIKTVPANFKGLYRWK